MTVSKFKLHDLIRGTVLILGIAGTFSFQEIAKAQFSTSAAPQATGLNGWTYNPVLTVGDTINGYTPVGILDGIGAVDGATVGLNPNLVRVLVNHEITAGQGAAYTVNNSTGTPLTINGGARVSYFDIDKNTRQIINAGLAYDAIYDRSYNLITNTSQFNDVLARTSLDRFCSSAAFGRFTFGSGIGFEDPIYFTGEETANGTQWALDIAGGDLWAVPEMGRGAWENWTELNTGRTDVVALLGGDDTQRAPLYLYVGQKGAVGDGSFLDRNGLKQGTLYAWKSNTGETNPEQFNGTGNSLNGEWIALVNEGIGAGFVNGYATMNELYAQRDAQGGFQFSRPEDLATNPSDGTQATFASTGRGQIFPSDNWGDTYTLDNNFVFNPDGTLNTDLSTANVSILYDGDDAGNGQFSDPDYGLRSPDNLDWGDDGYIYVQEDPSTSPGSLFAGTSREQPSIWQIDPTTGKLTRIAQLNHSAPLPYGQVNTNPSSIAAWESSGILDVTPLFKTQPGEKLFIFDVQAANVRGGNVDSLGLVTGGQLGFISATVPEPGTVVGLAAFGLSFLGSKRKGHKKNDN